MALGPDELKLLRTHCRDRLTPKPAFHKGPVPKDYQPVVKVKRADRPFPLRGQLRDVGHRFAELHPVYIFAGSGPGILPGFAPQLAAAIMAPHAVAAAEQMMATGDFAGAAAPQAAAGLEVLSIDVATSEEAAAPEVEAPKVKPEEVKKIVSLRLLSFEDKKKIAVVKEVRAFLGEGLKESKEIVEGAPRLLKKHMPRADAEAQAEKLRAAGAEVILE